MKLISDNKNLSKVLARLVGSYLNAKFAVAWASSGNEIFELIKKRTAIIKRAVIGTHFYQTHPDVLDEFGPQNNFRFILQPNGVFHPKIFLFWNKDSWEALIGSANLTSGALTRNSEAVLLIGSEDEGASSVKAELSALIDRYWDAARAITSEEAFAYREVWKLKQPILDKLGGKYGHTAPNKPPIESSVMSMAWAAYYAAVKDDTHGFEDRCNLLKKIKVSFDSHENYSEMPLDARKLIAGLPTKSDNRWGVVREYVWCRLLSSCGQLERRLSLRSTCRNSLQRHCK